MKKNPIGIGGSSVGMKEDILAAAWHEFARDGYHASVARIAERVGLKTPSLYSHYASKDEILFLTITQEATKFYSSLRRLMPGAGGCEESLFQLYMKICEYFRDVQRVRFWRQIPLVDNSEFRLRCRETIVAMEARLIQQIADIFTAGREEGILREGVEEGAKKLFVAMLQGILDGILLYNDYYDIDSFIAETWQVYWQGISK